MKHERARFVEKHVSVGGVEAHFNKDFKDHFTRI